MESWYALESELRAEWVCRYQGTGLDWEEVREAHRFGWVAALRPEYAKLGFDEVEPDLAEHWERRQSPTEESAWDYLREAVSEGWHAARRLKQRASGSSG